MHRRAPLRSRHRRLFSVLALALFAVLASSALNSSAAERPTVPGYPGLPNDIPELGPTVTPRMSGLSEVSAARQWIRVPPTQAIGYPPGVGTQRDNQCFGRYPTNVPGEFLQSYSHYTATLYLVSFEGAPEPFGHLGPFEVRTVAFGSIPVEATVLISQERDEQNLPLPIRANQRAGVLCPGHGPFADRGPAGLNQVHWDNWAKGNVSASVTALTVDGVDVGLQGTCSTPLTELELTSPHVYRLDPDQPNAAFGVPGPTEAEKIEWIYSRTSFTMTNGGLLTGQMTLPEFSGCRDKHGDDLSRLLTATVSGPVDGIEVRSEAVSGAANETNACAFTNSCPRFPELDLPSRDE